MIDKIYTLTELMEVLQVGERTLLDALRDGSLKGYKKFRRWYVFHADLEAFIKAEGKTANDG